MIAIKTLTAPIAVLAASACVALAQPSQDPSAVPSGTYVLDPAHTTVVFGVSHLGFSVYRGSFEGKEGTLEWNAEDPTKSALTVTIDANSVDSPKAVSHAGNANFQEDIAFKALGAKDHPEITFTTTRLEKTGDNTGIIYGDLTMNGKTGPVEMPVTLVGAGEMRGTNKLGFSGETVIDRTQWGSDAWAEFGIGTDVAISVEAEFMEQGE